MQFELIDFKNLVSAFVINNFKVSLAFSDKRKETQVPVIVTLISV